MKLLFESVIKTEHPFFSVCIETHNRGKTIYRALESLLNQGVQNFECIVADDSSSDDTVAEIERFISSDKYINAPYHFRMYQNEHSLGGVLNWNSPLENAKGKYIAGLEGDDYYMPFYLKKAYAVLSSNPNIGIYSTGSQRALRPKKGLINSREYFKYIYQMENVSPPSEFIFKRLNKNREPFKFDVVNNIYAPEIQLLLTISEDGWDTFHSSDADIYREPSTSLTNMTWKFFGDKFNIIDKFKNHPNIDNKEFKQSFRRQMVLSTRRFLVGDYQKKGNPESIKTGIFTVLKNKNYPYTLLYLFIFKAILFLKNIQFFRLYFGLKKLI
ncbi:MAG: glycosyltransferase family 2 protein [Bacteroidota bacterium]